MRHFTITHPYNPLALYSSLKWPEQGQPSESAWTLWRRALCECLSCNTQYILSQPLGHWISTDSSWGSFFHQPTNNLFVLYECRWHRFGLNTETFRGHTSKYVLLDHDLPPFWTSHVAVTWIEGNELITHGIGPLIQRDGTDVSAINNPWYFEWTESLPENKGQCIAEAIHGNTAIALTDGSFLRYGSAGFCIGDSLKSVWQGACRVPGPLKAQSAYRSELISSYSTLHMCSALCHQHYITSGSITIACDNISAGRSIQRTLYYPNPTWDHFDVLQAIFQLRHALPIKVRYKHVEGHQREKYP